MAVTDVRHLVDKDFAGIFVVVGVVHKDVFEPTYGRFDGFAEDEFYAFTEVDFLVSEGLDCN